jgi:hypothetical protein
MEASLCGHGRIGLKVKIEIPIDQLAEGSFSWLSLSTGLRYSHGQYHGGLNHETDCERQGSFDHSKLMGS